MARRQSALSEVVDTNVAAYFLLGTEPHATACEGFLASLRDGIAPATWEVEIANVLWLAVRTRRRLVTYDGALLRSFPDIAVRPEELPGI